MTYGGLFSRIRAVVELAYVRPGFLFFQLFEEVGGWVWPFFCRSSAICCRLLPGLPGGVWLKDPHDGSTPGTVSVLLAALVDFLNGFLSKLRKYLFVI